ncbi:DNA recombination protein RmuC [Aestuariimicrobium soli]|uniref:DNA recombination protein RmuC n=1 Tax=Aestuariimicrobium soli TaxID=2035834 RepID=UPI003EBE24B4
MSTSDVLLLVTGLLLGLAVGAFAAWQIVRSRIAQQAADDRADLAQRGAELDRARGEAERARAEAAVARQEASEARARAAESGTRDADLRAQLADAQADRSEAIAEKERVGAELAAAFAQRDSAIDQLASLKATSEQMQQAFELLSAKALEAQGAKADAVAQERLKATQEVLTPVTGLLKDLQERITQVEKERSALQAEMKEQVRQVTRTGEDLRRETTALSTALRRPQVRGAWGETQLKRVAESAGMLEHCDFDLQTTTVNTDDNTIRPDMRVNFGEGKFVWVDSKVPLSAFLDAQAATDESQRQTHLKTFAKHVRTHIDQLSNKRYWASDAGTPEFVILFIPSDVLFAEALTQMTDLHDYASNRSIVLTSPSSLIATLRTVAYSWKQAKLAESAAEVFSLGRELHTRLSRMGSNFDKLGRQLTSSVKAYNETVGTLEGRVFPQARKLAELGVTTDDLAGVSEVEVSPRQLTAPELVDSSSEVKQLAGRERRGHAPADGQDDLFEPDELFQRGTPSPDDLVESTHPRMVELRRRELS